MSDEPLLYFTKAILRDWLGALAIILAALWGLLGGVIIPLWISDLLRQIGTPEVAAAAIKLSGAAAAVVEIARRAVTDKAGRDHRAKVADEIGKALRHNPPVNSEGSPQAYLSQFFAAQVHAFFILTGELPQLIVGVGGFLVVLALQGVPWWAILILTLLIAATGSAYWALRDNQFMKNASECESKQVEHLAAIRSAWSLEQFSLPWRVRRRRRRLMHLKHVGQPTNLCSCCYYWGGGCRGDDDCRGRTSRGGDTADCVWTEAYWATGVDALCGRVPAEDQRRCRRSTCSNAKAGEASAPG